MPKLLRDLTVLLAFSFLSFFAVADGPLQNEMTAYVVLVDESGKETLKQSDRAVPGQMIEYQLRYENIGESLLRGITVSAPIPSSTKYVESSAQAPEQATMQASADNGRSYSELPVYVNRISEGGRVERVRAEEEDFTHIRWVLRDGLAAKQAELFSFRVRVN